MTDFDIFYLFSVVFGGALFLVLNVMIFGFKKAEFIFAERAGMGVMAGATLMLLPQLYLQHPTAFTGWATTVFWFGALVKFSGRLFRALRHKINGHPRNPGWGGFI
jgi:hypothetical protein